MILQSLAASVASLARGEPGGSLRPAAIAGPAKRKVLDGSNQAIDGAWPWGRTGRIPRPDG